MSDRTPTRAYFLRVTKGNAKGLGYGVRGGGLFTYRQAAFDRGNWLKKSGKIESFVVYGADCDWYEESE